MRLSGPLPGRTCVAVAGAYFVPYLDAGAAGRLQTVGRFLDE